MCSNGRNESELEALNQALVANNLIPPIEAQLPRSTSIRKHEDVLDIEIKSMNLSLSLKGKADRDVTKQVLLLLRNLKAYERPLDKEPERKYTAVLWHPEADGPEDNPVVWFEAQVTHLTLIEDLARTQAARNWNLDGETDRYEPDQFEVLAVFRGHHQALG